MDEPESPSPSESAEDVSETTQLNIPQRIIGVFCYPGATFEQVDRRPDWWVPLLVLTAATVLFTYLTLPIVLPEQMAMQEQRLAEKGLNYQQIEAAMAVGEKFGKFFGHAGAVVGPAIGALLSSLVLWFVGSVLLGGKTTYGRVLAVQVYSSLIGGLGLLLLIPLILAKESGEIQYNAALFLSDDLAGTWLHSFCHSLGFFSIWQFVVLAIGFSVIYKFSLQKAGVTMGVLWLLTVVFFTVMRMLQSMAGSG